MEEFWKSLHKEGRSNQASLWRQCLLSHRKAGRRSLKMDTSFTDGSQKLRELSDYRFVVHLWQKNGQKLSSSTNGSAKFNLESAFCLDLEAPILEQICEDEFSTLEIEVSWEGRNAEENGSALLYSNCGKGTLGVFGGGSFDEYAAFPWFQWFGDLSDQNSDWLPFVEVSLPTNTSCLNVAVQWRKRQEYMRGHDYKFVQAMNDVDTLAFLLHRISRSGTQTVSSNQPRYLGDHACRQMMQLRYYTPKPMSAYSFILQIKNTKDLSGNKDCSIFYESVNLDDGGVELEIPECFHDYIPWGNDFDIGINGRGRRDIDTTFTVFVVDRATGKQAKFYESGQHCEVWNSIDLGNSYGFGRSSALLQYPTAVENALEVPTIRGFMPTAFKEELENDVSCLLLILEFMALEHHSGTDTSPEDMLVFLEKGLVYE